jgi:hypothetical protein
MRVCRAGRKPGVEPFVVLHDHPKANHRSRFNHLPPIYFLPFGFGIKDFGDKAKQGILADALFV